MQFGLFTLFDFFPDRQTEVTYYKDTLEFMIYAEQLGFDIEIVSEQVPPGRERRTVMATRAPYLTTRLGGYVHFKQEKWSNMTSVTLLMHGEPVRSARTLDVMSPATGNTLATCSRASLADLNEAVTAARAAFAGWSSTPISGPRVARP